MPSVMQTGALIAFDRFGLGRRGTEPVPDDPRGWLRAQLRGAEPGPDGTVPSTTAGLTALRNDRDNKPPPAERQSRALFLTESAALSRHAIETTTPFRERLVRFWTNHFTISVRTPACAPLAGAFVAEAIRPHVTGRFNDMLLAVMRHPAMLLYLNNAGSVGPNSVAGQRTHRGLNENLARECMELHTISPTAGYTQADVTAFAAVLTGWSIDLRADPPGFKFHPFAHEPGTKTMLGRTIPEGEAGGVAALAMLANHPATHRHLATKLVRHFVADDPPPDAVGRIARVLARTDGDLGATSAALVDLPVAWVPGTKFRAPQDYVIAALRALDLPPDRSPPPLQAMAMLGEPLFAAPLPNGWSDRAVDWATPEGLMRRVDWSYRAAGRASGDADPAQIADAALLGTARPATLQQMASAGSRRDALTLLLTSPEFMRR